MKINGISPFAKRQIAVLVLLATRLILAACILMVIWQGYQSIGKYLDKPQASSFSIERFSDQKVVPVITIYPSVNREFIKRASSLAALSKCGL